MNQESRTVMAQREAYISQLTPELQSRLSPVESFEQLSEIREHLDSMAQAYVELGVAPEAAMEMAIAKFGSANEIGRKISHSVQTPESADLRQNRIGLAKLLAFNVVAAIVWGQLWNSVLIGLESFAPLYKYAWHMSPQGMIGIALPIGAACWYMPRITPLKTGLACAVLLNLATPMMLFNVRGEGFFANALRYSHPGSTLGVFLFGVSSAYLASRLREPGSQARRQRA